MNTQDDEIFQFKCSCCGEIHKGVPSFGTEAPIYFYDIPENEREERVFLTSDTCVIDDDEFYVKGSVEIPVIGYKEIFSFNAWVSLSEINFFKFQDLLDVKIRKNNEPMLGWFSSSIWPFTDTEKIKAKIHFRDEGTRPFIELGGTQHPLVELQQEGISFDEIKRIYEYYVHGVEE